MTVVIKIGGSVLGQAIRAEALDDLSRVVAQNKNKIIIVHGGGDEVDKVADQMGIEQNFITSPEGFRSRYTDQKTMELFIMVMAGKVNKRIVSVLTGHKIPAIGLSGLDGALIRAERKKLLIALDERGRRRVVEGGYTGRIIGVEKRLLDILLRAGYVPVIAPIAVGLESEPLNVDADRAAAYIGGALRAEKLLLLTDVEGVTLDAAVIRELDVSEAKRILPKLGHGMITKVYAAIEALSMGVREVIIAPGARDSPFSSALQHLAGTVVRHDRR